MAEMNIWGSWVKSLFDAEGAFLSNRPLELELEFIQRKQVD
jgi:hypothetical protein